MVIAERKPLSEILAGVSPYQNILVLGCGGCMTVGLSGGLREVGLMAQEIILATAGRDIKISQAIVQRQCEPLFIEKLAESMGSVEAVLSLGCGVGVQALADRYPNVVILPALNTRFLGMNVSQGVWVERCQACGECLLGETGGICPVVRCPKSLLNGPCGGSQNGMCEVGEGIPCAWAVIYERLEKRGELERLLVVREPKNWGKAYGPGVVVKGGLRGETQ